MIKYYPKIKKIAIIGSGFTNPKRFKNFKKKDLHFIYNADANEIIDAISKSDIIISGCGQTLYELAVMGIPTTGIGIADNQLQNIDGWKETGFLGYAGFWNDPNLLSNIKENLEFLMSFENRLKIQEKVKNIVLKTGTLKLIDRILDFFEMKEKYLDFRRVEEGDCDLIFRWANDPTTRYNSFNSNPIPYSDHINWFNKKLNSSSIIFLIFTLNEQPIGQMRVEEENQIGEISFTIDPDYRGKGYGSLILKLIILTIIKYSQSL